MSRDPAVSRWLSASPSGQVLQQFIIVSTMVLGAGVLALSGLGVPARGLYALTALGVSAWYSRRSPWLYVTFMFWLWTVTPLVRRMIDYRAGFDATSLVLAIPNAAALFMLRDIFKDRSLFRRPEFGVGLLFLVPCIYGFAVNLVQGQIFAGAVGASDWLIPMLYYFYAIQHAPTIKDAEAYFSPFLALNAMVIGLYSLYQFWQPTGWDLAWAHSSGFFGAADKNLDSNYLAFGTLNSTGINGVWIEVLMILSLRFRTPLMLLMLPALGVELLFTEVRSALAAVIVCSILAAVIGEAQIRRSLLGLVAAFVVIGFTITFFNPAVMDRLTVRMTSFGSLNSDVSAIARTEIIKNTPDVINQYPAGLGIGGLGRGALVSGTDLVSVDFGPLAIYLSLGWVGGSIYILGLCAVVAQAFIAARKSGSPAALGFAIGATGLFIDLPIVNLFGFIAVPFWFCTGMAAAYGINARMTAARARPSIAAFSVRSPQQALLGRGAAPRNR